MGNFRATREALSSCDRNWDTWNLKEFGPSWKMLLRPRHPQNSLSMTKFSVAGGHWGGAARKAGLEEEAPPRPPTWAVPRSPVAWQKRWKVPRACTCWAWSPRKGGSKVTCRWLSGPGPKAGQGLRGEEDESGPRQEREEDPGAGKGREDEAARQRTEKREGSKAESPGTHHMHEPESQAQGRRAPHPDYREGAGEPQGTTRPRQGYKILVYLVTFQMYTIQSRKIKTK